MKQDLDFENYEPEIYDNISDEPLEFEEESNQQLNQQNSNIQESIDKFFKTREQRFIIIKNYLFQEEVITKIKPLGFSILSFLLNESSGRLQFRTTVDLICDSMEIQKKNTVNKYLKILVESKLIEIQCNNSDIDKLGKHDVIVIDLTKYYMIQTGHESMLSGIYEKYYISLKEISWTIFCYLKKICFKGKKFRISYRTICENTGIGSEDTIHKYMQPLFELGIISITDNPNCCSDATQSIDNSKRIFLYKEPYEYQFII